MRNKVIEKGKLFRNKLLIATQLYCNYFTLITFVTILFISKLDVFLMSTETNKNEQRVVISICYVTFCALFFVVRNLLREIFASELIIFGKWRD